MVWELQVSTGKVISRWSRMGLLCKCSHATQAFLCASGWIRVPL